MEIKIQATNVLQRTLEAETRYKVICHEGGSRSSKTYSIFQFFILKALRGDNLTITIARDKLTWIKSTLLKDFQEITEMYGISVSPQINANRSEQVYHINGTEFAFFGLDYAEKLHGRKQDWFWINEVMEVGKREFDQLEMRTDIGAIIDYNPADDQHWIFQLQRRDDVCVIKSTMLDNPFLPDTIVRKIKGYEPTKDNIRTGTADPYMWEVYGLGNKARLQGVIFTNWELIDDIPKDAVLKGLGLDFGYTNDPTALVELYLYNNEIYLNELVYEPGMTNQDIVTRLVALGIDDSTPIYADSSEPKSIEEIRREGFNIMGVRKGQDSVNYGIDILKSRKMYVTQKSANLEQEMRKYKWMEDKAGKSLNRPVDAFNHGIDASRYVAMETLQNEPDFYFSVS